MSETVTAAESHRLAAKAKRTALEDLLAAQMHGAGLRFQREHRFSTARRWRLDFAFPAQRLGIEVEGGTWSRGRHVTGAGFEADCEKYNALAAEYGWRLLRFTATMVKSGEALRTVKAALKEAR